MTKQQKKHNEFVIKRNGEPVKCMNLQDSAVGRFMTKLTNRFPGNTWSVSARFPLYGSD